MKKNNASLKLNYIYNFISQILTLIIPLVTTPYLSRVLHEEGNGQYSFSFSIVTYFILFANLGFNVYGQREISKVRDNNYLRNKTLFEVIFARLISTLVSLFILYFVLFTIGFGEKYNCIILMLSIQVVTVIFDINFYYQGLENFKAIALRTIIIKILGLIGVFSFVKTENDAWIYALCLSISTLVACLIMWPSVIKSITWIPFNELDMCRHFKSALLIFLPTLAVTIYSVFNKTMIGMFASNPDYENGCYEQAYKINSLALLIVTIISTIFTSRNSYDYANGNIKKLKKHLYFACNYVWFFSLPLIFGFLALSYNLSAWFLGDGYAKVPLLLMIMSIRFVFSGFGEIFGNQLFIAIGKEKYPMIASFIAAFINIVLNCFFIQKYGAIGGAIATSLAEFMVTFILLMFTIKGKYLSCKKIAGLSRNYLLSAVIMFASITCLQRHMGYSIASFSLIVLIGCMIYCVCLLLLKDEFVLSVLKRKK